MRVIIRLTEEVYHNLNFNLAFRKEVEKYPVLTDRNFAQQGSLLRTLCYFGGA